MKFNEALELMKNGYKMKLPSWAGFWIWDVNNEFIMDIRETQNVEYTLENVCSDEWIVADETNTPILGGEATFNFGEAIKYLKRGMSITKKSFSSKDTFIFLANGEDLANSLFNEGKHECKDTLCISANNVVHIGYMPDVLAEDYMFVEEIKGDK